MTCPSLTGTHLKTCSAAPDAYSPSAFQFEEYCAGSWHTVCPFFGLRQPRTGPIGTARRPVQKP